MMPIHIAGLTAKGVLLTSKKSRNYLLVFGLLIRELELLSSYPLEMNDLKKCVDSYAD